ncbi:hypothetical protein FA10DRAFT_263636, partial [Acaromyces ingoldii]
MFLRSSHGVGGRVFRATIPCLQGAVYRFRGDQRVFLWRGYIGIQNVESASDRAVKRSSAKCDGNFVQVHADLDVTSLLLAALDREEAEFEAGDVENIDEVEDASVAARDHTNRPLPVDRQPPSAAKINGASRVLQFDEIAFETRHVTCGSSDSNPAVNAGHKVILERYI